ncbi:hypothetical protein ACLB1O_03080 [Escherichia coli]
MGIKGDSDEKCLTADIGISRLLQMQRDNGGFALWDKNGDEEYWLTAYVMDFLVRAGEQGYSAPIVASPLTGVMSVCCAIYKIRA